MRPATGAGCHAARVSCVALGLLVTSCSSTRLRDDAVSTLARWWPVQTSDDSIALHHEEGGTIAANLACGERDEDAPPDILAKHELIGLDGVEERSRERILVNGRLAFRCRVGARLDGVPVELDLVVLQQNGCVVDARLVGSASVVDARRADFDRFVAGLRIEPRAR